MGRISQWAVRRPWWALFGWVGIMVVIGVLGARFGGDYNDNFQLPDTESTTAQDLLAKLSGGAGTGTGLEGQVVWKPQTGKTTDAAPKAAVTGLLTQLSTSPGRGVRADAVRGAARFGVPGAARGSGQPREQR